MHAIDAKIQELEIELESVKVDFHNRSLVNQAEFNQLREIIEDHRKTEKKLEDTMQ